MKRTDASAVSVFFVEWRVSVLGILNWGHRLMGLGNAALRILLDWTRRAITLAFTDLAC